MSVFPKFLHYFGTHMIARERKEERKEERGKEEDRDSEGRNSVGSFVCWCVFFFQNTTMVLKERMRKERQNFLFGS